MAWIAPDAFADEQALVRKVGEGDQGAFRILFDRYHVDVFRFCTLLLGDSVPAQDVYQETFLAFYRTCCSKEEIRSVRALLITIARNRCLDLLKRAGRRATLDEAPERVHRPEFEMIEMEEQLQHALTQIAPQYREALLLFEVEGYSYKEIAEQLNVSLHVVKNRIYTAKCQLRAVLEPVFNA